MRGTRFLPGLSCAILGLTLTAAAMGGGKPRGAAGTEHFFGLPHTAQGQAQLGLTPDGHLIVSNIGSSGKDGVRMSLGQTDGFAMELHMPPSGAWPSAAMVCATQGDPQTDDYVHLGFEEVGGGQVALTLDIGPGLTPHCVHVHLMSGGAVVDHVELPIVDGAPPVLLATGAFGSVGGAPVAVNARTSPLDLSVFVFEPVPIAAALTGSPNGPVQCDGVYISLDGLPPGEYWLMGTAGLALSNLPNGELAVSGEWLHSGPDWRAAGGQTKMDTYVWKLGNAQMAGIGPPDICAGCPECCEDLYDSSQHRTGVTVSNIGSSGLDGVAFQCRPWGSPWFVDEFYLTMGSLSPDVCAPCSFTLGARGTLNGSPDRDLGRCRVRNQAGSLELLADFTALGVADVTIEVHDHGVLSGSFQAPGGPGTVVASIIPGPGGFNVNKCGKQSGQGQPPCFVMCTDDVHTIIGGGQVFAGDEIRVLAVGAAVSIDALTEFSVTATNMSSFTCAIAPDGNPAISYFGGEVSGLGSVVIGPRADLDGDGSPELIACCIGSSGKDGVEVRFPRAQGARILPGGNFNVDSFFDITYRMQGSDCPLCPPVDIGATAFAAVAGGVTCAMSAEGSPGGTLSLYDSNGALVASYPYTNDEPLTITVPAGENMKQKKWLCSNFRQANGDWTLEYTIELQASLSNGGVDVSHPVHGTHLDVAQMRLSMALPAGVTPPPVTSVKILGTADPVCNPCTLQLDSIAPILFDMPLEPMGAARLHTLDCDDGDINDELLIVSNIGSSGQDGVRCHLIDYLDPDSDDDGIFDLDQGAWLNVKPSNTGYPDGSTSQWAFIGLEAGATSTVPLIVTSNEAQPNGDTHVIVGPTPWMAPGSIVVRVRDQAGNVIDEASGLSPGHLVTIGTGQSDIELSWSMQSTSGGSRGRPIVRYDWDFGKGVSIVGRGTVLGFAVEILSGDDGGAAGKTFVFAHALEHSVIPPPSSTLPINIAIDDITIAFEDPTLLCVGDMVSSATFQPPPDGQVDGADLAYLLGEWGPNAGSLADFVTSATFQPPPDGLVDGADLAILLGAWGPCD